MLEAPQSLDPEVPGLPRLVAFIIETDLVAVDFKRQQHRRLLWQMLPRPCDFVIRKIEISQRLHFL